MSSDAHIFMYGDDPLSRPQPNMSGLKNDQLGISDSPVCLLQPRVGKK